MLSLLTHVFLTERHHPRAGNVGHAVPAVSEIDVSNEIEPLLATNMKCTFLRTWVSSHGHARFGFSECSLDQEGALLGEFYRVLVATASREGWRNVVSSVPEALERMRSFGNTPQYLVMPEEGLDIDLPDGVLPLLAGLPEGAALVTAPARQTGLHTRIGNHVGVLAYRVNTSFVAVVP